MLEDDFFDDIKLNFRHDLERKIVDPCGHARLCQLVESLLLQNTINTPVVDGAQRITILEFEACLLFTRHALPAIKAPLAKQPKGGLSKHYI